MICIQNTISESYSTYDPSSNLLLANKTQNIIIIHNIMKVNNADGASKEYFGKTKLKDIEVIKYF
jgi:hypothetical protein